ncbi:lasso peptide biosynthesis PqqD family chaperone [Neobacillus sp. PS3-12]|jgi:hypothetical protein|uniref:lasso peptide biosynthesis PqqD family chaperone n=1 Tax=Neobacillus sp. PS3-12 TaxID=3070677 RepID=UPI0027E0AF73|nr:lasso peptide biosynthesis PqqD family chaperone [Neobacillus sp. PS3-12]WML51577.1 lasso peptide biosynthesis PqqD family chaperone [Neobacillus sp. PS3-12]
MIHTSSEILLKTTVVQCEGNIASDMNGEKVLLNVRKGKYFNLGTTGGEIWGLIKSPIKVNKLVDVVVAEFEVEKNICELQVLSFLNQLYKEDLVKRID